MSRPGPFVCRTKALPAKRSEKGYGDENVFVQLMNSTDYYVNMQLVQFISSCFEMRDKLLSNS